MSVYSNVQLYLNDAGVFWPQAQVLSAINEAQMWMWMESKWSKSSATLNVSYQNDIVSIPSSIIIPQWIDGVVNNNDGSLSRVRFFPSSQRNLEHFLRTWRGAGLDQPGYFVLWDATHFRLFPRPDKSYTYTIWGISLPTEITSGNDVSGPSPFLRGIEYYSLAILLLATRPDLSAAYLSLSEKELGEFKKLLRNQQPHNIRRLRPGGRFDLQQSGNIRELPSYYPMESSAGGSS